MLKQVDCSVNLCAALFLICLMKLLVSVEAQLLISVPLQKHYSPEDYASSCMERCLLGCGCEAKQNSKQVRYCNNLPIPYHPRQFHAVVDSMDTLCINLIEIV